MADIRLETDGLRAAGSGLAQTAGSAGAAPRCDPAAADPVSGSVAAMLTYWSHVLSTLMEHADQQRQAGGLSVVANADYLDAVDEAGAARIATAATGDSPGITVPVSVPTSVPSVPLPTLPPVPQMPTPRPLTGEQFSVMVHSEPGGPARLRAFAREWRNRLAPHILATAHQTRGYADSIQQRWDDGDPQAAINAREHADWLESSLHSSALGLADSAEQAADQADTTIQNTPTPEDFRNIHTQLNAALAQYHASGGRNGAQVVALSNQLGETHGAALVSYHTYQAGAVVTTRGAARQPSPAPPIVRGDGPAGSIDQHAEEHNPGAHRGETGNRGDQGQGAGSDTLHPGTANFGAPPGSSSAPPIAPPQQPAAVGPAAVSPTPTGTAANIAGAVIGASMGSVGQLANSLHGLSAGSPLSALSGLSSLPGLGGMPHAGTPHMPSGPGSGAGDSIPDPDKGDDFGSGGTIPAGGGPDGDGAGGAPISTSSPAVSGAPSAAGPAVATPAVGAPAGVSAAAGGPGMYAPPVMGGLGRGEEEGRKSKDRRRVVVRRVVNGEPVFGEVERKSSTRRPGGPRQEES